MKKNIVVLAGDGVGNEVMPQAIRVLNCIADKFNHIFVIEEGKIGGAAFEKYDSHFPQETKKMCEQADAILFGSVGGPIHEMHHPKWENCEKNSILALRKAFQLSVNLRPFCIYKELEEICPLKKTIVKEGVDILIVRELIGDIYFGEHIRSQRAGKRYAIDVAEYDEQQISSVAHRAFQFSKDRRKKLTSVDKANVLETSKLWREIVNEVSIHYPEVKLEHMLVDNCAMQLVINPGQFDVILAANLFGDILSDEAAALPGSLGMIPSASFNSSGFGLYEPSGGSAPDIAGKNCANPIAQISSVAMMLRYSFKLTIEADTIEMAIRNTLKDGYRTQDIYSSRTKLLGTHEMTNVIIANI